MKSLILGILSIVAAFPFQAQAQTQTQTRAVIVTVGDLQGVCKPALEFAGNTTEERAPEDAIQTVRCFGFVEGVVSTVIRLSVAGFMIDPLYEGTFCFPDTVEPRNWIETFVGWAEDNPEKVETPAVDGFLLALIEAYPCDGSAASNPASDSP